MANSSNFLRAPLCPSFVDDLLDASRIGGYCLPPLLHVVASFSHDMLDELLESRRNLESLNRALCLEIRSGIVWS